MMIGGWESGATGHGILASACAGRFFTYVCGLDGDLLMMGLLTGVRAINKDMPMFI